MVHIQAGINDGYMTVVDMCVVFDCRVFGQVELGTMPLSKTVGIRNYVVVNQASCWGTNNDCASTAPSITTHHSATVLLRLDETF